MVRPKVDLPQPDSPTTPRVSPSSTLRLTPSTAFTASLLRENRPSPTGKCFFRARISNRLIGSRPSILRRNAWSGFGKMAGDEVILLLFYQLRFRLGAQSGGPRAAVTKSTAAREVQWA